MAMWVLDYLTGEIICKVCGKKKGDRTRCCRTAPYISFETFYKKYFKGEGSEEVPYSTRREFYDDYRMSDCRSLQAYIEQTTEEAV